MPTPGGPYSGIWKLKDLSKYIQDDAWATLFERATFGGGQDPGNSNVIDYITISTTGNATDFGDLTVSRNSLPSGESSSTTRGIFGAGYISGTGNVNTIDYITFATTGNSLDFGDELNTIRGAAQLSSDTRGITGGGLDPGNPALVNGCLNVISYITIASTGNALDFGDMAVYIAQRAGFGNSTRGLFAGGYYIPGTPGDPRPAVNSMDYFTIATLGNSVDFGDLTNATRLNAGFSNTTRGVISMGDSGKPAYTAYNNIDYVTIATTGNATDFGDLLANSGGGGGGVDNTVRGVFAGPTNPGITNIMEYVTIDTTGNSTDFGDLSVARRGMASASSNKASSA
jgi:hypothetical protein